VSLSCNRNALRSIVSLVAIVLRRGEDMGELPGRKRLVGIQSK
jgi:hypothetical protein